MTENLYEGMFLLNSGKFAANPDGMTSEVLNILEKSGGTVVAHRPWQDGRLAYIIEKQRKGLHYLTYFRMEGTKLKDVNRACRLNDNILRHLVIKQPQSLFDVMVQALNPEEVPVDSASAVKDDSSDAVKADSTDETSKDSDPQQAKKTDSE